MHRMILFALLILCSFAKAEMPLELIQVFRGNGEGAVLATGCISPGDLDGDGFSELFTGELGTNKHIYAFKGGMPPDTIRDLTLDYDALSFYWIPDINGDDIKDFCCRGPSYEDCYTIDVWFGSPDFYSKTEPDMNFSHSCGFSYYFGFNVSSGDVNGDGQCDLIIAEILKDSPYDGKFIIYFGGESLDTTADDSLIINSTDDFYNNFFKATSINDLNGDGLVDYAFTSVRGDDYISYVNVVLGSIPIDSTIDYKIATPFWGDWKAGSFGDHISALGDINKDGYADFAVGGATTWPCIFYGGDQFDTIPKILGDTLDTSTQGNLIVNIGDINHDGWDDIGVGFVAWGFDGGIIYIYYGSSNMDSQIDLVLPYSETVPLIDHHFGEYLGSAGDFNGDGVDDIAVSGRKYGSDDRGTVFIYAGDRTLPTPAEDENETPIPQKFNILSQNYPNPFNNQTVIEYELWGVFDREIEISIYNILGQNVRTLFQGMQSGGRHIAYWDGKNDNGHPVSSGIYFYRLSSQNEIISKKMIYLK